MLTLEKIIPELKANTVNEVVGGRNGETKSIRTLVAARIPPPHTSSSSYMVITMVN